MTVYNELKTIRDYIRYALSHFNEAALFYGHGTDNAWDEALALVLHSLYLPPDVHPSMLEANLTKIEQNKLAELIAKRVTQRIPVPYLTHEAWFAGLSFYVDERVLIPRSPIAELIEKQFIPWVLPEQVHKILDLCTGSGCIAIACAKYFPEAEVYASDISIDALAVAKTNALRHHVEDQVKFFQSDLFDNIPNEKFDLIVSNPPYVSTYEMNELPPEYLHEPKLGLAAGTEGLDIVIKILQKAHRYLTPQGVLIIEVGNSEITLTETFPEIPFTWIEFERGGGGVFTLTADQLSEYLNSFNKK